MPSESLQGKNIEQPKVAIEIAKLEDWEDYKKIRLEAIEKNPEAFALDPENLRQEIYKRDRQWKETLKDPNVMVFLLREGKDAKGLAITKHKPDIEEGFWRIYHVYVSASLRGKGAGEKLMTEALEKIKERGGKKVWLNIMGNPEQSPARNLYQKLGFIKSKEVYEKSGKKLYFMQKELKE